MALQSPSLRVVIIDDQPLIRKGTRALVEQQPGFLVVGECGSVREAQILVPGTNPDLLLLDIELSDGNAFDILQEYDPLPFQVIFLTAYREFAIQAIKFGALDYLVKPIDQLEFEQALGKALRSHPSEAVQVAVAGQRYRKENDNLLVIHSQQYIQVIDVAEITYCQSDGGYTTFHLVDGKKIVTSKYLKEYEEMLPANRFLRPHQSYLVNYRFIDRLQRDSRIGSYIILKNGTEIPVSIRRKEYVASFFSNKK